MRHGHEQRESKRGYARELVYEENERLRADLKAACDKVLDLAREVQATETALSAKWAETHALKEEVEKLNREGDVLASRLSNSFEEARELRSQLSALQIELYKTQGDLHFARQSLLAAGLSPEPNETQPNPPSEPEREEEQ